jgi:xanthine/uracil permease
MSSQKFPNVVQSSPIQRLLEYAALSRSGPVNQSARKRPTNLLFDVSDTPPFLIALGAGVQHVFLMSVGWLYIVIIAKSAGATAGQTLDVIRISMIASGIATILQSQNGRWGSGYLCPLSTSLTFLPCSILAVLQGGFPLLFGMVAASGLAMCLLSRAI